MKFINEKLILILAACLTAGCGATDSQHSVSFDGHLRISGIYPHLAFYNNEAECGTGAVVPWAGYLWAVTYAPHSPYGSSDKLYRISAELEETVMPESIGGTPADRLVHTPSGQLFIGPYAIDGEGNVRAMSYRTAPGRYTGAARHLTDPDNKIYIATMEEGFYEVDVHTLDTRMMWSDDNVYRKPADFPVLEENLALLPGWHGKGLYSGQGVLLYSNNGEHGDLALERFDIESGSLNEWNGSEWKTIRRNQFTELTGPGGIYGNENPETDPIWSVGFDYKSLLLGVREYDKGWSFYRLPKASYAYDGAHGWNTEWPRIRDVGTPRQKELLMTMHGMFWHFPETFASASSAGIRPRSAYLKVIGDFTRWGDCLVMGCDDSAQKEFLNTRKAKGGVEGPGQSNSNLWFMSPEAPDTFGPGNAGGYVWLRESVEAGELSDPFLFAGWENRCCWIKNNSGSSAVFTLETDADGDGSYAVLTTVAVPPFGSRYIPFGKGDRGEWIRVRSHSDANVSIGFAYTVSERRTTVPHGMFDGLAVVGDEQVSGGLLYGLGGDRRTMALASVSSDGTEEYFEIDKNMNLLHVSDPQTESFVREKYAVSFTDVEVQEGSVLVVDDSGRRWRLPLGDERFTALTAERKLRICREVATERDLFNCHGTFYELPAENADGYAKIRPIASHNLAVNDYASYRGLLIMTGIRDDASGNPHIFRSPEGRAAVWAGAIDDLWQLGKPVGRGGPWINSRVARGEVSDPYLIGFYDRKSLEISHDASCPVVVDIEVDPTGDGEWVNWKTVSVAAGAAFAEEFPAEFAARWIRFRSNGDCRITTRLEYR